jgi:hypothetical protein
VIQTEDITAVANPKTIGAKPSTANVDLPTIEARERIHETSVALLSSFHRIMQDLIRSMNSESRAPSVSIGMSAAG